MNGFESVATLAILFVRPGMLVLATPFLGSNYAPPQLRVGLMVLLTILLAPFVAVPAPLAVSGLVAVVAREMAIGLAIALAIRAVIVGAEFAGHFSGYQIGLSVGSLIDPITGVRNNIFAILYANLTIVICFATNAHHLVLRALVDSYRTLPIGLGGIDPGATAGVAALLGVVFVLGVRIAAPVIIVLLLVELALGLLGRVAPALNVMIAGAPVRLLLGLLVISATLLVLPSLVRTYVPIALRVAGQLAGGLR
ncbi:MAG: flagellar biosynthetic protein FliR [Vicinamibacterales bacterium]